MTTSPLHLLRARVMLALVVVLLAICTNNVRTHPVRAADMPLAGDDAFQTGPLTLTDEGGVEVNVVIDRAYGPLADTVGHLVTSLLGASVSATADLDIAPALVPINGEMPAITVAVNGVAVPGPWGNAPGQAGVYRLSVSTAQLRFPAPGDATNDLVPQANTVTLAGEQTALQWLRITVPGVPPVLLMAGADLGCTPPGPLPVEATFGDWERWLTADGVPFAAPDRDGHLTIAEQLPFLDTGYAALRHAYGPDRPGLSPRVTLVGYSMGGLVARRWAVEHPGVVARFVTISAPNSGTEAAGTSLATVLGRCAAGAVHDLTPEFVADFNSHDDLAHYWDPAPASGHVVSLAAAPAVGNLTDGLVSKDSALALPYAVKLVWTPTTRVLSLHQAVMHAPQVYRDVRTWAQFDQPLRDPRIIATPG